MWTPVTRVHFVMILATYKHYIWEGTFSGPKGIYLQGVVLYILINCGLSYFGRLQLLKSKNDVNVSEVR